MPKVMREIICYYKDYMYKSIIIGCGRVSSFHADSYALLKDVELVGAVEIDEARSINFSQKYKLPVYKSILDCVNELKPDIVSICTPHNRHYEHAKLCLELGLNVILEKPACLNLNDIDDLIQVSSANNKLITVCFQNQFNKSVEYLNNLVHLNLLGEIKLININLNWYRDRKYYEGWHNSIEESGGGVLMTQAIHHLDELVRLLGIPKQVTGFKANLLHKDLNVEDTLIAILKYENCLASLNVTNIAYPKSIEATITILGSNGTIKLGGKSFEFVEYINNTDISNNNPIPSVSTEFFNEYGTSHINLIANFINTIKGQEELRITLESARATQKVVKLIYESIKSCP